MKKLISNELRNRIMNTMNTDLTKVLAATAEELNELAKECCKAIRQHSYNCDRIQEELADVIVMCVGLIGVYGITDGKIEQLITKVCERYEIDEVFGE